MILGAIPGATPDKWVARWQQRYPNQPLTVQYFDEAGQLHRIRAGTVDLGYLRLVEDHADDVDTDLFHRVWLYTEEPVICAAADHWIAAAEHSVSSEDIADEPRLNPADMLQWDTSATGAGHSTASAPPGVHTPLAGSALARGERLAIETAATGAGVVVLPRSVARILSRKDIVTRRVDGLPGYRTGLAWLREKDSDQVQEFIGIARGRTAESSRSSRATTQKRPRGGARGGSSRR
ncbi:LysR family transcriptional regulator substrate-binding protein [Nesterenkonia alba]|uniref:LysR family transcriptional regulator substrate-binding protein n=1 Tax=Nesterenkonia alba TaxID=515814 RepID=UPI0003B30370|nr:LysR family transcriptional regulator substrate-binding protein [Nesterenkonia alba]